MLSKISETRRRTPSPVRKLTGRREDQQALGIEVQAADGHPLAVLDARQAVEHGGQARFAGAQGVLGGAAANTGTLPSKTLRETVLNLTGWRERGFYGRAYRVKKDIAARDLMTRLHMTLDHEVDVLEHQFNRNGVHTIKGAGRFLDPRHIEVTAEDGTIRVYRGERILLAVGTRPHRPADRPRPRCPCRSYRPRRCRKRRAKRASSSSPPRMTARPSACRSR